MYPGGLQAKHPGFRFGENIFTTLNDFNQKISWYLHTQKCWWQGLFRWMIFLLISRKYFNWSTVVSFWTAFIAKYGWLYKCIQKWRKNSFNTKVHYLAHWVQWRTIWERENNRTRMAEQNGFQILKRGRNRLWRKNPLCSRI